MLRGLLRGSRAVLPRHGVISGRLSVRVGSTVGLQRRTFYLGNATADAKNPAEVEKKQTKFDLAVIGGGSGGMSCAASAAKLGKSVVLFDHVSPSLQGSAWGVGGTCVNVGCIPKKLMHQASLFRDAVDDAADFGWDVQATHNWATLRGNIQTHIRGINFGYHAKMKKDGVTYVNERANLSSDVTVESVNGTTGEATEYSADHIVVATGGRPTTMNIPGSEFVVTSDDFFSLREDPGKTLFIGGGFIALELAGVLNGFGNEVVVMQRNSTYLRGFDRGMVKHITADMARHGVKFATDTVASVENLGSGDIHGTDKRLRVKYTSGHTEEFETVVECIGRLPASAEVFAKMRTADGESALSINTDGYCEVDEHHTTNIQSVHVIGDLAADSLKLTPAAIVAGRFLAERLFSGGTRVLRNEDVPVTVFTPLEYGFVGLSEEEAVEKYGRGGIDVHHARFQPLQWQLNFAREEASCYAKYIVVPGEGDRVVGIHFAGPHAGEVLQGFAVAFTSGITKEHMLNAVGIHPTTAEELVSITATYSNGEDPKKTSC